MVLGLIFIFLAIDETALIHEKLWKPTQNLFNTSGLLYYAWVIPYGIISILFVLVFLKFLIALPPKTRNLMMLSGSIFVFGAIVMEMIGGWYAEQYSIDNFPHQILYTIEESWEMMGIALFIPTLIHYLQNQFKFSKLEIR